MNLFFLILNCLGIAVDMAQWMKTGHAFNLWCSGFFSAVAFLFFIQVMTEDF